MLEKIFKKYHLDFSKVQDHIYKNNNFSTVVFKDHVERNRLLNGCTVIVDNKTDVILYIFERGFDGYIEDYYDDLKKRGYSDIYVSSCEYHDDDNFIGTLFLNEEVSY